MSKAQVAPLARSGAEIIPNLDALPPMAACTDKQVSLLIGCSISTLKRWRRQHTGQGPKVTVLAGRPRYLVSDLRAFMGLSNA